MRCTGGDDGVYAESGTGMLKYTDNPPILSPWVQSLTELQGAWWVAHTKARNEKAFAWDCHAAGIGYFLPLYERRVVSGKRLRRVLLPLFPSYVFFCGDSVQRYEALTTNRLCQVIPVTGQEELIAELSHLEHALRGKAEFDPFPYAAVGQTCRITAGPFRGVEGVVVHRDGVTKIILRVSILSQGAMMKIDAGLLEPLV